MSDESEARKTRTRGHVVADLGINCAERQVLLAGMTLERKVHDYGFDAHLTTYDADGVVENETVWVQVKATDHPQYAADGQSIGVRVQSAHFRFWLLELLPAIVVLYDATADRAYWIEAQEYATQNDLDADEIGTTLTLRLPTSALFTPDAVREIRVRKEAARVAILNRRRETR